MPTPNCDQCGQLMLMAVDGAGIGTLFLCVDCARAYDPSHDFWYRADSEAVEYWKRRYENE